MTDSAAALAEAIPSDLSPFWDEFQPAPFVHEMEFNRVRFAAAILAALDGWMLVPRVATADWCGSVRKEGEIARLRKIEEAAWALLAVPIMLPSGIGSAPWETLRAALDAPE